MSITINVEEYCQNCRSFEPSVASRSSMCCGDEETVITVVKCESSRRCRCMYENIKERMKETRK